MKRYEVMYIVDPNNEEKADDIKKKIEGIVTGREGSVDSFEVIGKKRLAYPIAKRQYGIYILLHLRGDGRIIQALDYFLRMNPTVLRYIVLAFTEKEVKVKKATEMIQLEEAERMRMGGRPLGVTDEDPVSSEDGQKTSVLDKGEKTTSDTDTTDDEADNTPQTDNRTEGDGSSVDPLQTDDIPRPDDSAQNDVIDKTVE